MFSGIRALLKDQFNYDWIDYEFSKFDNSQIPEIVSAIVFDGKYTDDFEPLKTEDANTNNTEVIIPEIIELPAGAPITNGEIIDAIIEDPSPEVMASTGVNFTMLPAPTDNQAPVEEAGAEKLEDPEVKVTSTPKVGDRKVQISFAENEKILSNFVDYDSFIKIKQSDVDIVIKAVRMLNFKATEKYEIFCNQFKNVAGKDKFRFELIRNKKADNLVVRLSTIVDGMKYFIDIYPLLNKVDLDYFKMKNINK